MALENEARFHLPEARYSDTIARLNMPEVLFPFKLTPKGKKRHSDTYFDANGDLRRLGWSLRTRISGNDVRVTLKSPVANDASVHGDTNEELENSENSQLFATIAEVVRRLEAAGVVSDVPNELESRLMVMGAFSTLREVGMKDLFTVTTTRHRWVVSENSTDLAELAVDESFYEVGTPGLASGIRECRIEVELFDANRNESLTRICNLLLSDFEISEVHDSKFQRGMLHFDTRGLRDKLEVKVKLGKESDYAIILDRIEHDLTFVRGHRFTRMPERTIFDVYFDTSAQELFQKGHYLRLRSEGGKQELVFRRLTQAVEYGHVLQEEVVAKGEGEDFRHSWRLIQRWLSETTGRAVYGDIPSLSTAQAFLNGAGFRPVLDVSIERLPWIVERIDESKSYEVAPDHVAKLKYDQITTRQSGRRDRVLHSTEFEVTGVESDSVSPGDGNRLGYEAFVPAFEQACSFHATEKKVEHILSAKYFEGMLQMELANPVPFWVKDNRLRFHVSFLRQEPNEDSYTHDIVQVVRQEQGVIDRPDRSREIAESIIKTLSASLRAEDQADAQAALASFLDSRLPESGESIVKSVVNVTVSQNQATSSSASAIADLGGLAGDLLAIVSEARHDSTVTADQVAAIEAAQDAAQRGDEVGVIGHLREAAAVALSIAKQIGAPIATAFIEAKLHLK